MSALLALLLEIAHRYLANYGECRITINGEKELLVEGGGPLLFALADQGIFIPSACGGRGTCAYCKLKVFEGGGPVLPTETPYLTDEEVAENVRLSCQVKVRNDLTIEIPEELFLVKQFRAKVDSLVELTPLIKGLYMEILEPDEGLTFKPGQYVQLEIPASKGGEPEFRAYSICSACSESDWVELVITKVPDGTVSTYVHDFLKVGDEITFRGPFGDFYYQESDRDMLMIATGSGMAPIRSILHHLRDEKIERKATFFFGGRTKSDLFYLDEMRDFEKELHDFTFVPTLSRPDKENDWDGEVGRVTNLLNKYLEDDPKVDVYICGSPPMVESCEEILTAKGVPLDRIFYDKFA